MVVLADRRANRWANHRLEHDLSEDVAAGSDGDRLAAGRICRTGAPGGVEGRSKDILGVLGQTFSHSHGESAI
jgi:hypothetical protein